MTDPQKSSFLNLVRGAWQATSTERPRFLAFVLLFTLSYTLDLLSPWAIGYTLGVLVKEGFSDQAFQHALFGICTYTGLRLICAVLHHTARYLQNTVSYAARMSALTDIFSQLMHFPLRWHIRSHSGESLSKLHRTAGAIDAMIGTYVWQVVEGLVKVVGATAALLALDLQVAANVLIMSLVTIFIMVFFNNKLRSKIRQNNAFANKINRICVDYLFNIVTVKTLALEDPAIDYLKAQRQQGLNYSKQISKYSELKWSATGIGYSLVIGSSLVIYFLNHRNLNAAFDVAEVYVLLNYLDRIFQAIGSFTAYYGGIIEAATSYEDAVAIHNETKRLPAKVLFPVKINPNWKKLLIDQIDFHYEGFDRRGLSQVHLSIERNEKIALVGPSGGGKSTLLKTLAGLLTPDIFEVSTDLEKSLTLEQISSQCLLIPQEPEIFSETVLYNLTMGEDIDRQRIDRVVQLCRLDGVLAKLPSGIDSELVEKGLNLSVGEKQRTALARGLLRAKTRPVILLDEPTSSLDPATEKQIFSEILTEFSDRAIMTACHRLALVPLFDRIIYVAQGKVLEQGSFEELMAAKGAFFAAWEDYERRSQKEQLVLFAQ